MSASPLVFTYSYRPTELDNIFVDASGSPHSYYGVHQALVS